MQNELKYDREVVFTEKPPFPRNMMMELASICNHKCVFCGYRQIKRKRTKCDKVLFFRLLKEAYELGTREVGFYLIGEPLVCNDLEDYVEYAHELGYTYIYMTTNGALAYPDRMLGLIGKGLNSIKYSINAATRKTYEKIHGRDDFEQVKANVIGLSRLMESLGGLKQVPLFISFVKCEWNKAEEGEIRRVFGEYVQKIYIFNCECQGGGNDIDFLIREGVMLLENIKPGASLPCPMVFNRLHITAEGFLDACCEDMNNYTAIADLDKISLEEAWYSDLFVELRRKHLKGELEGTQCHNCLYVANKDTNPINSRLIKCDKRF